MKVTVRLLSGADHLSQILTGFQMLSRENKLTLDILDCRKDSPVYQEAFLEAQVNGIRILWTATGITARKQFSRCIIPQISFLNGLFHLLKTVRFSEHFQKKFIRWASTITCSVLAPL
mgnify:FL=1